MLGDSLSAQREYRNGIDQDIVTIGWLWKQQHIELNNCTEQWILTKRMVVVAQGAEGAKNPIENDNDPFGSRTRFGFARRYRKPT